METQLKVTGIGKTFGALRALSDVSFDVKNGEIFGIAGPNGSGKSTLFNVITGIPFAPDEGRIEFEGQEVQNLAPHLIARAGITRTFQHETDFESLSVLENARLAAHFGGRGTDATAAAQEALAYCGISQDQFDRPAGEQSVFDKKRLMIATAVAMNPAMLLMDEPASGLTKPEIAETAELITRINARGITIILIEHVLGLLLNVSRRLMVLNEGTLLTIGDPQVVVKDDRVIEAYLGSKGRRDDHAA